MCTFTVLVECVSCVWLAPNEQNRRVQVEVSSPNAEMEKTICTNSLFGATMCTKISTSLYDPTHPNLTNHGDEVDKGDGGQQVAPVNSCSCGSGHDEANSKEERDLTSNQSELLAVLQLN